MPFHTHCGLQYSLITGFQQLSYPITWPLPRAHTEPDPNELGAGRRRRLTNVDGDSDYECLVIYRYNVTGDLGPLGGVVFDPQITPGNESVSGLVTYRLLPWINNSYTITSTVPGSYAGYLGTLGERSASVRIYDINGDGKGEELGIVGTDAAGINHHIVALCLGRSRQRLPADRLLPWQCRR